MNTTTTTETLWDIDTAHSEILFKVKHMMVSTVTGRFTKFEGKAVSDDESFEIHYGQKAGRMPNGYCRGRSILIAAESSGSAWPTFLRIASIGCVPRSTMCGC